MGAQSHGRSLHRHGNNDTAQRQAQEGNYDGDNLDPFFNGRTSP